jgi:hypothetical protein
MLPIGQWKMLMYFELTAPDKLSFEMAYWDAQIIGLDPQVVSALTFNIGTGSIEKVSRIRDKFNLKETYVSDYEPTGYTGR